MCVEKVACCFKSNEIWISTKVMVIAYVNPNEDKNNLKCKILNVKLPNLPAHPKILQRSCLAVPEFDTGIQNMPREKNQKFQHIQK